MRSRLRDLVRVAMGLKPDAPRYCRRGHLVAGENAGRNAALGPTHRYCLVCARAATKRKREALKRANLHCDLL